MRKCNVASTRPSRSPLSAWSTCDSPMPATRQVRRTVRSASALSPSSRGATCVSNMSFISRGTPGMKYSSLFSTRIRKPGARPFWLRSTSAPAGTRTWCRLFGVTRKFRSPKRARIRCSCSGSITGSTPRTRAATSTVRSSSVGPSPPETQTTRARPAARSRASSMSGSSSVTDERQRTCSPRAVSRSASHGELVSTISPRLSSSPTVRTSASSFCMRDLLAL